MILLERQQQIVDLIRRYGHISVKQLAETFQVSESSIRNDLSRLSEAGLIERTHGGARLAKQQELWVSYSIRLNMQVHEKNRIAEAAARLVPERGVIGLDGSTTTLYLAKLLAGRDITVVTNGIFAALELAKRPPTRVIIIGGELDYELGCVTGPAVGILGGANSLVPVEGMRNGQGQSLNLEIFFTSPTGLTPNEGLMDNELGEYYIKRAMIASARRVVALADHTKVGRTSLLSHAPTTAIHQLITDSKVDRACVRLFEDSGVLVTIAE